MKNGDFAAKAAIVKATQANVERLEVMEGFKRITRPSAAPSLNGRRMSAHSSNAGSGKRARAVCRFRYHKLRLYVEVSRRTMRLRSPWHTGADDSPERPGRNLPARWKLPPVRWTPPQAPRSYSSRWTTRPATGAGAFANVRLIAIDFCQPEHPGQRSDFDQPRRGAWRRSARTTASP